MKIWRFSKDFPSATIVPVKIAAFLGETSVVIGYLSVTVTKYYNIGNGKRMSHKILRVVVVNAGRTFPSV